MTIEATEAGSERLSGSDYGPGHVCVFELVKRARTVILANLRRV